MNSLPAPFKREHLPAFVILALALLLGGYFRFTGLNYDDYVQFHPDERFMTGFVGGQLGRGYLSFTDGDEAMQEAHCRQQYPDSNAVGGYFDARCSDWNPHNIGAGSYVYGTLPPFTARVVADALTQVTGDTLYTTYDAFPVVMRTLSAIYDMLVIVVVFAIGWTLRGPWVAALASMLYAGAVLPIQIAHFATADSMANLFVALTLLWAVRAQLNGRWLDYALAGAAFGAALACRFNVIPLVIAIIGASAVRMLPILERSLPNRERLNIVTREFGGLMLAGLMTFIVFRVLNPYAFVGPSIFGIMPNSRWLDDLVQARHETSPANGAPPQWQWVGRVPYVFPMGNMLLWGMGLGLGLAGWVAAFAGGWRILRGSRGALSLLPLVAWITVYFGWIGGNFVTSMRYFLPLYPALTLLAAAGLIGLIDATRYAYALRWGRIRRVLSWGALALVTAFTLLWAGMFTNIYRHQATYTQAGHWVWENLPGDFAMRLDGAPDDAPLLNVGIPNSNGFQNQPLTNATHIESSFAHWANFIPYASGTISTVHAPKLGAQIPTDEASALRVWVTAPESSTPDAVLAEATLTSAFPYMPERVGQPYDLTFDPPLTVEMGTTYRFYAQVTAGPSIASGGTILTWEGAWDEVVPPQVCTLPAGMTLADDPQPGILRPDECNKRNTHYTIITPTQFNLSGEDDDSKRAEMIRLLDLTDVLIVGTNRRYDSQSRIQSRWPLTMRYYEALFSGELGFELTEIFHESFELGPLKVSDQHLPIYDSPGWLNEFEAEEAFHVYDHPAVMIFTKSENYDPGKVAEILGSVSLVRPYLMSDQPNEVMFGPLVWDVQTATTSPTQLRFTPEMWNIQTSGGTWSERFDRESPINTSPILTVVGWYLLVGLLGLSLWPVLFHALAGLSDRGYAVSRFAALLFLGWLAWTLGGSVQLQVWNQGGLWLLALGLAALSALIAFRTREALTLFIREKWRLILGIEGLTLALFLLMLGVRLSNPDLWTAGFGGEKPMDFAYFNGVLRSTIFPPIDPWYAGGYLNYYYFGYVIVGVPTLMTGILPSIAYNLILPTLFAAIGMGAFSLAYTLADTWRARPPGEPASRRPVRLGNPWVAGIAALLMAALLGNLDTPRTALKGLATLGGYDDQKMLLTFLTDEYALQTGTAPEGDTLTEIIDRANNPSIIDNVRYELSIAGEQWRAVFAGIGQVAQGGSLPINSDRWFWGPSRVITESVGGGAITEMPFFTFVYGDLHAHMITMPLVLMAMAFTANELLLAGREKRRRVWRVVALALLGGMVWLTRAANTWDFPTLLALGTLGLGMAWWLRWRRLNRRAVLDVLWSMSVFFIAGWLAVRPFTHWFASNYNTVKPWEGNQTPLWAFLTIHGLFLFVVTSLLLWETARWLRSVKVRALRGKALSLLIGALAILAILIASVVLAVMGYQAALVTVPLIAWIAIVFFRPGQSVVMQIVLAFIGLAVALTLAVEIVVLDGDIGRQNTVFKFYIHVWLLFSVACGAGVSWLLKSSEEWRRSIALPWFTIGGLLLIAAALFPIMAVAGKSAYRLSPEVGATLDGSKFMDATDSFFEGGYIVDMSMDAEIIRWLQDNVQGSPVIIEGRSRFEEYQWGGRINIHTGLPSIIGWNNHQRQQRTLQNMDQFIWNRIANVNYFYSTTDTNAAWDIIKHYDIRYVVVGSLERGNYASSGGLAKFDLMAADGWLEPVLTIDDVPVLYRVTRQTGSGSVLTLTGS